MIFYKHRKETRFHFLKNKAGMLYKVLVSYYTAYIKIQIQNSDTYVGFLLNSQAKALKGKAKENYLRKF